MKSMFIYAGLWHIQFNKLASVFSFDGEMPSAFSAFFFFERLGGVRHVHSPALRFATSQIINGGMGLAEFAQTPI